MSTSRELAKFLKGGIVPKRSSAQLTSVPVPIGGLNTRDDPALMGPMYAQELENLFPGFGTIDNRTGITNATDTGSLTNAGLGVFKYNTSNFLLISADGAIWSWNGTTLTDIEGGAALASYPFIYFQQFRDRIFMKDDSGQHPVYHWTGTGNIVASGFAGPTGGDTLLGPMHVYKNRLYFAYRSTLAVNPRTALPEIWYGGVDAVTGALTQFSFASVLRQGGYIMFIGSVTRAKDFSEDELFCVVSSSGEVLVYQGEYPGSASWSIIGKYFVPRPLGVKAFFYFGSDLIIMTIEGAFSMRSVMGGGFQESGSAILNGAITDIIRPSFAADYKSSSFGVAGEIDVFFDRIWTGIHYPLNNQLLLNIAESSTTAHQYVMNTVTGAWCKFSGWNALAFAVYKDRLHFITSGTDVFRSVDTVADVNATGSQVSRTEVLRTSYNDLGVPNQEKQFKEVRPTVEQNNGLNITLGVDVDYNEIPPTSNVTNNAVLSSKVYKPRVGVIGIGNSAAIHFERTNTSQETSFKNFQVLWEDADII